MNRLTERLSAAFARLAFWRKPAPATDAAPDEAPVPDVPPAEAPPPADAPELIEDTAPADALPAGEAQAAEPPEEPPADRATDVRDEADPPAKDTRRLFALLSKKIVWIPAASLALFALVGTLGALLWQSGQDRAAPEAKLKTAERQLEQAARPPVPAATTPAAPPAPADAASTATAGTASTRAAAARPAPAGGDCNINDVEGVSLRLKDCIDAFNQAPAAGARPARAQRTP